MKMKKIVSGAAKNNKPREKTTNLEAGYENERASRCRRRKKSASSISSLALFRFLIFTPYIYDLSISSEISLLVQNRV